MEYENLGSRNKLSLHAQRYNSYIDWMIDNNDNDADDYTM